MLVTKTALHVTVIYALIPQKAVISLAIFCMN